MRESEVIVDWPVIRQIFELSVGTVKDGIFYRTNGAGYELGDGAPMIQLVATRPAQKLGRPGKRMAATWTPTHMGYGLDAKGHWWRVQWDARQARARSIASAPYAKMGRRRVGWVPVLKQKAAAALHTALVAQYAERCPLI